MTSTSLTPALFIAGILLWIISGFMLIPLATALVCHEPQFWGFAAATILSLFLGGLLKLAFEQSDEAAFKVRSAFFFTAFSWTCVSFVSAIPFWFSESDMTFSLSFLESTSALTTTGFSAFSELSKAPLSIIVWRSLLQWLGGLGISIMALTLFPFLKVGGMQLFASESSSHYEKILPKVSQIAKFLFWLYTALTVAAIGCLWLAGMPPLDAFCYGMGTVSTSGLSLLSGSVSYLENTSVLSILMIFMFLSASPLLLAVQVLNGNPRAYLLDPQMRAYTKTAFFAFLFVSIALFFVKKSTSLGDLHYTAFNVLSMLTTAGFHAYIPQQWPTFIELTFIVLCLIGGCTGSTAGGIKIFRFQIIYRAIRAQTYKMIMPHGIFTPVYDQKAVSFGAIYAVITLVVMFMLHFFGMALLLLANNLPVTHSLELSANILSNCGAHFFNMDLAAMTPTTHWIISTGMLLGRLEFLTIWVLFVPFFWRR